MYEEQCKRSPGLLWLRSALRQNLALLGCNMGSQFPPTLPNERTSSSSFGLRGKGSGEVLDAQL